MYPKCTPHRPGRLPQKGGGPVLREQQANDREITTLRSRMQPKLSSGPPLGRTSKTTNLTFGNVNCKPHKPQPDWLLYAHVSGKWAKKTRGTVHYFGNWEEAQKALKEYVAVKDDPLAGRTPIQGGLTICDLVNRFLSLVEACLFNKRGLTTEARISRKAAKSTVQSICTHQ